MDTHLSTSSSSIAAPARTRVLVVDDSPSFRKMVSHVLKAGGYDVLEASDAREAMSAVERSAIGLVLTDQNLPGTDGLMLVRDLRSTRHCASVPIIMLTTESSAEMKAAGRAAGATGWVVKPFDPNRLLALVQQVTT
jgi:two-component system chemotaxis response regulator CheY